MDPGLAFGTGTHQTTDLCLQYLDENPPIRQSVIDYGSGTGILAIAAVKLGANQARQIASHGNLFYTRLPKLCLSIRQKLLYQYYKFVAKTL
jgi:hypothetical protein